MKSFRDYFRNYIILNEFTQATIDKLVKKFEKDAPKEKIEQELRDFEKYKASLELKDPFQYKTWVDLTQAVHGAKGKAQFKNKKLQKDDGTKNYEDKGTDILAEDDNVIIYKGDSEDKCVLLGNGYPFCISRLVGGNMYNDYRLTKESSFYFIFFKKKSKSERDHIMVLDHRNDGYEWTFAENNTKRVQGGWDEIVERYPELAPYEDLFEKMPLTQEEREFNQRISTFVDVGLSHQTVKAFEQTFEYKERPTVLKRMFNTMNDTLWDSLDSFLRNEFIGIGPNLSQHMIDSLKPNEREYYKKRRDIVMKQTLSQLDSDDEFEAGGVINEIEVNDLDSDSTISYLLEHPAGYKAIYRYLVGKVERGVSYKDLDEDLVYELLINRMTGYDTARFIIGLDNLDADMKEHVIENMSTFDAADYATDILRGENVPDKIFDKIVQSRYGVSRFVNYYRTVLNLPASELPPYLLQLAKTNSKASEEIYSAYGGKGLPRSL